MPPPLPLPSFVAAAALLAAPGPTNALLASAGAQRGHWRRLLGLAVCTALGYLASVALLARYASPILADFPWAASGVRVLCAAWLLCCARRLWRGPARPGAASIGPAQALMTTLVNPKALVFALSLAPAEPEALLPFVAGIASTALLTSLAWGALGCWIARELADHLPSRALDRAGAGVLAAFASAMAASALG
ncbi:hypothetical protein SLNSH_19105 [Alsobacter soli]|uniref:Threonine transporter RhtB n=1 Tax=Alsobacter soli TaxID=2109933 RepID=A0A2T1HP35_9HYPH|nr:LysE family transporter [Alsobacter soli]PSC03377.1 hypothetical protein SLNSH_19105 [Alsobacter soli]